mgnify:CR=1 FL=1
MKKKVFLFLSLCMAWLPLLAQDSISQGIHFEDLTLKEACAKAKTEGKKVFVDCYTQTCIPCKYMMKNIFPMKECGDWFNPRFVSIARDMAVSDGPEMGKKYDVGIYPTFLIINPDGTLFCKEIGAVRRNSKMSFVEKMKRAIERGELAGRYASGERSADLVRRYVELLKGSGNQKATEVVNEYLGSMSVEELCKADNWNMLVAEVNSPDSPVFRKLLDNRSAFEEQLGKSAVESKLMSTYQGEFGMYKMMGMPFGKRVADLQQLAKDGNGDAQLLADCMTVRWIINDKASNRAGEVVTLLQQLKSKAAAHRMAVVKELPRFERIATTTQRQKACSALKALKKGLSGADSQEIDKAIDRISPNK